MVGSAQRQGPPRHAGAERARWLDRLVPGARPLDDRVSPQSRLTARAAYQDAPIVADYFRRCEEERRRRRGEHWRLFGGPGTMFPNVLAAGAAAAHARVCTRAGRTRPRCGVYFVDADAPTE